MSRMTTCRGAWLLFSLVVAVVYAGQGTPCLPFTTQSTTTYNSGGTVQNPRDYGYPCEYAQVNCSWLLDAGSFNVQLQINRFFVSSYDVVTIYDGPSMSSPIALQGDDVDAERVVTSSGNTMLVVFNVTMAAYWHGLSGFQMNWLAVVPNKCSGTLKLGTINQILTFPSVGGMNYTAGLDCKWQFSGNGYNLPPFGRITVTAVDLAEGDSLMVANGAYGEQEYPLTNGMVYTGEFSNQCLVVHFKSTASSATALGFNITFDRIFSDLGCLNLDLCQTGVIQALQVPSSGQTRVCLPNPPFYSGRSCTPINCTVSFYPENNQQSLQAYGNYEEPYNGGLYWDPNDPTFPRLSFPTSYSSSIAFAKSTHSGNITINFYAPTGCSDKTAAVFTVKSIPAVQCNWQQNNVYAGSPGEYFYPLPYNGITSYISPMRCILFVNNGYSDLFAYVNVVSSDIKDGDYFRMSVINGAVFALGGSNLSGIYYPGTPGVGLKVEFISNTGGGHGFDLLYGGFRRTCNSSACTNPQGLSYSVGAGTTVNIGNPCPNAVSEYQNSQTCRWTLYPPSGQYASIAFDAFDLAAGDLVTVYQGTSDTAPLLNTFSATSLPSMTTVYSATAGPLFVKFASDASGTARGFYARAFAGSAAPATSLSSASTSTDSSTAYPSSTATATATATASTAGTDGSTSATATATSAGTATATGSSASATGDAVITGDNGSSPAPSIPVVYIGAGAGGLVVLIIIVALIIVVVKKRNRSRNNPKASFVSTGASSPPPQSTTM